MLFLFFYALHKRFGVNQPAVPPPRITTLLIFTYFSYKNKKPSIVLGL